MRALVLCAVLVLVLAVPLAADSTKPQFKCGKTYITIRGVTELPGEVFENTGKLLATTQHTKTVPKTSIIAVLDLSYDGKEIYIIQTPVWWGRARRTSGFLKISTFEPSSVWTDVSWIVGGDGRKGSLVP